MRHSLESEEQSPHYLQGRGEIQEGERQEEDTKMKEEEKGRLAARQNEKNL